MRNVRENKMKDRSRKKTKRKWGKWWTGNVEEEGMGVEGRGTGERR